LRTSLLEHWTVQPATRSCPCSENLTKKAGPSS
jgi:hypothetical protein